MKLETRHPVVTVFGSSRPKRGDPEYRTAYELGNLLAEAGFTVCNGGYGGTMEASARGAKNAGGRTIGVVTKVFGTKANPYIDRKVIRYSLVDRLLKLVELGDAYIVLRGGTGTLVELAVVWEYMNKRLLEGKPILAVGKFWLPVINTLKKQLAHEGRRDAMKQVTIAFSPKACVEALKGMLERMER